MLDKTIYSANYGVDNGITQMQLTEFLNCEPPTVTNMVKTLEKKGFVYRKKDSGRWSSESCLFNGEGVSST